MERLKKIFNVKTCIYIICFVIPLLVYLLLRNNFDNDLWYILAEGRYILNHGIYYTDVLSMHEGLDILVQNYLSAIILYGIYKILGFKAIYLLFMICDFLFCFITYKLCKLISDGNKPLSLVTMTYIGANLSIFFIVTRPQVFSYIILLLIIYLLELYIKKGNSKFLIFIPILTLLEVNLHSSHYLMILLIFIPYIIDSFKNDKLNLQGYPKKDLLICFFMCILFGFFNPYGYEVFSFIFKSFFNSDMHEYIKELSAFNMNNSTCIIISNTIIISAFLFIFFRKGKVRFRYLAIYGGFLLLSLFSLKGFGIFIALCLFPIAYLLKDIFPRKINIKNKVIKIIGSIIIILLLILVLSLFTYLLTYRLNTIKLESQLKNGVDNIDYFSKKEDVKVFASFNYGGYVEFRGYKAYIDPRAEVFLKINNHKEDIYHEYNLFEEYSIDLDVFLEKYNFDYIVATAEDRLYYDIDEEKYFIIYDDSRFVKVYMRSDLVNDSVREKIKTAYNNQL